MQISHTYTNDAFYNIFRTDSGPLLGTKKILYTKSIHARTVLPYRLLSERPVPTKISLSNHYTNESYRSTDRPLSF